MMLAVGVKLEYETFMPGVPTIFLNADVEDVKIPPGYDTSNKTGA